MDKFDYLIIILFILIVVTMFFTLKKINIFMPVFKTCEDDLAIVKKCNCVPDNWKDKSKYYGSGLSPDSISNYNKNE